MNNSLYKILLLSVVTLVMSACEQDHPVTRSKNLSIYGPGTVFVGDVNTFEAPLFTLNDTRPWKWSVGGPTASPATGDGEFFDVEFGALGMYTVTLSLDDREGSVEVEAVSKEFSLDGSTTTVSESYDDVEVAIPITFDNYAANPVSIDYTISGTAVEGVDYELLSANPLVLDADAGDDDYAVVVLLLADTEVESPKTIIVTLNSATPELADEVILGEDVESTLEIVDDIKTISVRNIAPEDVTEPTVVSFEIEMSAASAEDVTVNYTLSGTGVTDATPDGPNSITFAPGETRKTIFVKFNAAAFNGQTVSVTLNSLTTSDDEAEINPEKNQKSFNTD